MKLQLILPAIKYKKIIEEYQLLFKDKQEVIHGSASLGDAHSIDSWLLETELNQNEDTVKPGLVPSTTYLAIDEDLGVKRVVGMVDIRHRLNDHLLAYGGHIGYSVAPDLRNQGYAKAILALALIKCKELEIEDVLVTCDVNNVASSKVIMSAGATLENIVDYNGKSQARYWIKTQNSRY